MDVNKDGSVQYEEFIDAWLRTLEELGGVIHDLV